MFEPQEMPLFPRALRGTMQVALALVGAGLTGCATVSLDSPDWDSQRPPVVKRSSVPAPAQAAPAAAGTSLQTQLEDAGVIVTPVSPSALDQVPAQAPVPAVPTASAPGVPASAAPVPDRTTPDASQIQAPQDEPPSSGTVQPPVRAVDWEGNYYGLLPCADCEGIRAILTLRPDASYILSLTYEGRNDLPLMMRGHFTWDAQDSRIELDDQGDHRRYVIGNGEARMLNRDGTPITGVLANRYVLKKRADD